MLSSAIYQQAGMAGLLRASLQDRQLTEAAARYTCSPSDELFK